MATSSDHLPASSGFSLWERPAGCLVGYVLVLLFLILYVFHQVTPLLDDRQTGVAGVASHQNDFKHLYLGSRLLGQGLSPYDPENMLTMAGQYSNTVDRRFHTILPFVYLPFTGLVMAPIAALPFPTAVVVFQILNHLMILGSLVVILFAMDWRGNPWPLAILLAMTMFSTAVYRQNNAGQLNAFLLFGMSVLFLAIAKRWHPAAVGGIAAVLMLFKLTPGIFLIYFLLRRQWMRAVYMAGIALGLTIVTVLIYGIQVHLDFLPVLAHMGYGKSTWAELGQTFWRDPYNISFNAFFHRTLVPVEGGSITAWLSLSPAVANALTWLCSLGILGLFGWACWRSTAKGRDEAPLVILAVCASLLVPSIFWDHYLVQLYLPIGLLLLMIGSGGNVDYRRGGLLVVVAAIIAWPQNLGADLYQSGAGLALMNFKLLAPLILFGMGFYRIANVPDASGLPPEEGSWGVGREGLAKRAEGCTADNPAGPRRD